MPNYSIPEIRFAGLFGSSKSALAVNDLITTTINDQEIPITDAAGNAVVGASISMLFTTNCEIQFNDYTGYVFFNAGMSINFDKIGIQKIKVKTSGSKFSFWGLHN